MTEQSKLPAVPVDSNGVKFQDMDGMVRFAGVVERAGWAPKGLQRKEQIFIAMQFGLEVGLSPMQAIQNIAVINGKPTIWGDGALALVMGTGLVEDSEERIDGEGDNRVAICMMKRKGVKTPTVRTFSVADAKTAGLWGKSGPWKQYPNRMLQMRARGFAIRDAFPDALHGLITAEEAQDYVTVDAATGGRVQPERPMPKPREVRVEAVEPAAEPVVDHQADDMPPAEIYEAEAASVEDIKEANEDSEGQKQAIISDIRMLAADEGWTNKQLKEFAHKETDVEVKQLSDLDVFQLGNIYDKMFRGGGE